MQQNIGIESNYCLMCSGKGKQMFSDLDCPYCEGTGRALPDLSLSQTLDDSDNFAAHPPCSSENLLRTIARNFSEMTVDDAKEIVQGFGLESLQYEGVLLFAHSMGKLFYDVIGAVYEKDN